MKPEPSRGQHGRDLNLELSFLEAKQKEKIFAVSLKEASYLLEEPQPCLILSPERNLPTVLLGTDTGLYPPQAPLLAVTAQVTKGAKTTPGPRSLRMPTFTQRLRDYE